MSCHDHQSHQSSSLINKKKQRLVKILSMRLARSNTRCIVSSLSAHKLSLYIFGFFSKTNVIKPFTVSGENL